MADVLRQKLIFMIYMQVEGSIYIYVRAYS